MIIIEIGNILEIRSYDGIIPGDHLVPRQKSIIEVCKSLHLVRKYQVLASIITDGEVYFLNQNCILVRGKRILAQLTAKAVSLT
jgi:hypothetical protein